MKPTIAAAAIQAIQLRGEPSTARQTLDAIAENGLYSFGAVNPLDLVRRQLKKHSKTATGQSEPELEELSGKRFFLRNTNGKDARAGLQEATSPESGNLDAEGNAGRKTIIRAISQVMGTRGAAMTVKQVYAAIIRDGLYEFKASEPIHVVRSQIRRHSLGIDFPTASETKHFEFEGRGKYRLLKKSIKQASNLSHIGVPAKVPDLQGAKAKTSSKGRRSEVFVSYSHRDEKWLRRLQVHLAPLEHKKQIVRWDDTKLQPGKSWRKEIATALSRASIAILLVSADFLASEFILQNELPPLLRAVNTEGVIILPVIVSACRFEKSELGDFQALNSPNKPLNSLQRAVYERIFVQVADAVESALYTEG